MPPHFRQEPTASENRLWEALNDSAERITELGREVREHKETTREMITSAVREAMPRALLTEQQHRWVEMAIEREAQSIAFRRAVIEKTTSALVWALLAGLATAAWSLLREWANNHGLKI